MLYKYFCEVQHKKSSGNPGVLTAITTVRKSNPGSEKLQLQKTQSKTFLRCQCRCPHCQGSPVDGSIVSALPSDQNE